LANPKDSVQSLNLNPEFRFSPNSVFN